MPTAMPDVTMDEANGFSSHAAYPTTNGINGVNGIKQSLILKAEDSDRSPNRMDVDATPRKLPGTYIPQFNGSSRALILERIRHRSATPSETIKILDSSVNETPLSATLVLPESSVSPRDLASLRASSTHQRLSLKRKRDEPTITASTSTTTTTTVTATATTTTTTATSPPEVKEFTTQTTLPLPTPKHAIYPQHYHPSPSSPAVPSPPPTCSKCSGRSTPGNILVACAKCPASLHQQCSTPHVDDFRARDGSFICRDCLLHDEGIEKKPRRQLAAAQQEDLERMRRRRLDTLPDGVVPAKPSLVGFRGGDASSAARSQYFSDITPTDLLNIISFSNQLKPQLLVDLLVSISKRHPDLPIFDSPDWASHLPPLPPSSHYHHSSHRPRVLPKPQINRPRHRDNNQAKTKQRSSKAGGTKKMPKPPTRLREVPVEASQPAEEEVVEDVLPPTWKPAGQGMYALLPLETDDRSFMTDANDEESFSHFMVDKSGHQIIAPV
ncbi:hypothetical protein CC79DRAFT_367588 [Sarocladium strictum]